MAREVIVRTSDKEVNRMLKALGGKRAKAAIRKSSRPALKPVLRTAKSYAPVNEGDLQRSLTIRAIKRSRKRIGSRVTTREGMFSGQTFYGGFQEWGWQTGKRGSSNRRFIPGAAFMKRAAEDKRRAALTIYRRQLRRHIIKLARQ